MKLISKLFLVCSFLLGVGIYLLIGFPHSSNQTTPTQVLSESNGINMEMSFFPGTHRPEESEPLSQVIAVAEILEIGTARWNTPDGLRPPNWEFNSESITTWLIYTPVTFSIVEKYKGDAVINTSQFAIVGGQVGEDKLEIDSNELGFYSDVSVGDKVVLFLNHATGNMLNVAPYTYVDILRIENNGEVTAGCNGSREVKKCRAVFTLNDVKELVKSRNSKSK
jgi:hypothetical protein